MKTANISVDLIGHYGTDLSVVNAARVSFNKESSFDYFDVVDPAGVEYIDFKLKDSDIKLINYLAKHKHFSPFNHAFLSFRVKAPIFVARQLVKHKFLPWNEVSRRYVDEEPEFYCPNDWRERSDNVKQGSKEGVWIHSRYIDYCNQDNSKQCLDLYQELISGGCCPEQARMVLPQNTMTEWVWSGTLGAFLDMLVLRLDPHTQKETRIVAEQISKHVQALFPVSYKARIE